MFQFLTSNEVFFPKQEMEKERARGAQNMATFILNGTSSKEDNYNQF